MLYKKLILNFFVTCSLCLIAFSSHARFKCWTNSDGIRECGENVPPEYAQQGHEEINKLGITVDKHERAKTEEEIEAEKQLAKEKAEQERIKQAKERDDQILLQTFSSVEDINLTRDGKIASLETAITLSGKRIEKIQSELDILMSRAAIQERKGKTPSEDLINDINSLKRQIKNNEEFIVEKRKEQNLMREEYAEYVNRYNELKR